MKAYRLYTTILILVVCLGLGAGLTLAQGSKLELPSLTGAGQTQSVAAQDGNDERATLSPAAPGDRFLTYQGRLTRDGQPVNGTCNFKFSLWDAESAGHQIGSTVPHVAESVQNGLYTTEINTSDAFGDLPFRGAPTYLEVEVACPTGGSYTKLLPRQHIASVPYAQSLIPGAAIVNTDAESSTTTHGLWVESQNGFGVLGRASNHEGLIGESLTGVGVRGTSNSGIAVWATGNGIISSTADSKIYISPWELRTRPDSASSASVVLGNDGFVTIHNTSGTGERYFMLPVQSPGVLFGAQLYVKALKVCYKTVNPSAPIGYITATAMGKNSGVGAGLQWYFIDEANHNAASECYEFFPASRKSLDGPSWVQLNIQTTAAGDVLQIYDIVLTLSEVP